MPPNPLYRERAHVGPSRLISRHRIAAAALLVAALAIAATVVGPGLLGGDLTPPRSAADPQDDRGDLRRELEASATPGRGSGSPLNVVAEEVPWIAPLALTAEVAGKSEVVSDAVESATSEGAAFLADMTTSDDRRDRNDDDAKFAGAGADQEPRDEPSPSSSPSGSPSPRPSPSPSTSPTTDGSPSPESSPSPEASPSSQSSPSGSPSP